uniref:Nucleolar complex associated 4 homolog n=1 Tax=Oryctolagus cuniculus TaxID=9986 RepID=A0A5F9C2C8_RABIT
AALERGATAPRREPRSRKVAVRRGVPAEGSERGRRRQSARAAALFGALLERGELFVGQLPPEEVVLAGSQGATRKYKVWMRHRYHSCCNRLAELLAHPSFQVKELALETLMKFVQLEGTHPLEKPKWEDNYLFPRELFKSVVRGLLSPEDDGSLLLSRFREYLEHDDIRYHAMQAATDTVARVTDQHLEVSPTFWNNAFSLLAAVSLPPREPDVCSFYVKRAEPSDKWKVVHLKEHRKAFQAMWLGFLKHKLPLGLYKKVLVILHDSILPHLAQPTLMIDFLTSAYDVGGAVSLLALNGLFILIHEHNLLLTCGWAHAGTGGGQAADLVPVPVLCVQSRQRHHQALSVPEVSIAPLLELTAYEIFERDLKKKRPEPVPLEFLPPQGLLGRHDSLCSQLFTLS